MTPIHLIILGIISLGLSGCVSHTRMNSGNALNPFTQGIASFSESLADSKAVSEFKEKYGSRPVIEIAPSKGLSRSEERLLRHQLIQDLLSHGDKVSLVVGPGQSRRSTSNERFYSMRHGKMTDAMPIPGHVSPANFMILPKSGRDPTGHNWVWLTVVRLDNNQIIYENAVPEANSDSSQERFVRPRNPTIQRVRFTIVSELSSPVGVWLNPTFPTFGMNDTGTIPPNIQPTAVINPGSSSILEKFIGTRRGNVFICVQGTLYKNVCRKFSLHYNDGEITRLEIVGIDQYGFVIARQILMDGP